jgi:cardiolipin synthase
MKLCSVDGRIGFVGGINLIDDHIDLRHGRSDCARLDYAAQAVGPVVVGITQAARAVWSRASLGRQWRSEVTRLLLSAGAPLVALTPSHDGANPAPPGRRGSGWLRAQVRLLRAALGHLPGSAQASVLRPALACFVVRDNLRQRRGIERAYVDAIRGARRRILLVSPYFYPGGEFRRALCEAARRGVHVQLLLQGKLDYRLAGLAARALYDELLRAGVHIHEYMPAFLHAKVAVVDEAWATVGSSNIDPLSLLLNLEANLVVRDTDFCTRLAEQIGLDLAVSRRVDEPADARSGWRGGASLARRALVAWVAHVYLRIAGVTGRY